MTTLSAALQRGVFETLAGDAALATIVGTEIHDGRPAGALPDLYVSLGPEEVRDRSDKTRAGAEHRFEVAVFTTRDGFADAKAAAAAVSDALDEARPVLTRGRVISLTFLRARARRLRAGQTRAIEMTFRAIVEDG